MSDSAAAGLRRTDGILTRAARRSGRSCADRCVVKDGPEVLGYVGLSHILDEGYISNVAVAEKARRQGIADTLLARLDTVAAEYALSFISLEVRESNLPAIRLYEKNGYEKTGMIPNCYTLPKENALVMTKTYH